MALRRITTSQQLWVPRWLTSFLPTGNRARYIPTATSTLCPRCNSEESHRFHVIRCPHPGAHITWQQGLNNLDTWLVTQHTQPLLRQGIVSLLQSSYEDRPWVPPPTADAALQQVFQAQQTAGTNRVFDGFLVCHWAEAQHQYYLWINRKTTGKRWLARLIQKIWEIAWDLWRHRHKIMTSTDSLTLSRLHVNLDDAIRQAYDRYTPAPPPSPCPMVCPTLPSYDI